MRLNTVKKPRDGSTTWCGPGALSIITGRTVKYCAKLCAEAAGWNRYTKRPHTAKTIKGVYHEEMKSALNKMGFTMTPALLIGRDERYNRKTLRAYMAGRGGPEWKAVMLVCAGNHYVVINRDTVSDNQETAHYSKHKNRLKRIHYAWIIERKKVS